MAVDKGRRAKDIFRNICIRIAPSWVPYACVVVVQCEELPEFRQIRKLPFQAPNDIPSRMKTNTPRLVFGQCYRHLHMKYDLISHLFRNLRLPLFAG